jgi:hypothetical protein
LDPDAVPREILTNFADSVLASVRKAVWDPATVAKGKHRMVETKDETDRAVRRDFVGGHSFVAELNRAPRRVTSFMTKDSVGNPIPLRY